MLVCFAGVEAAEKKKKVLRRFTNTVVGSLISDKTGKL